MIKAGIIKKIIINQSKILTCLLGITYQASVLSADLEQGKSLFEVTCSGCHAKDLSGGAGFNLKDEEWVHGDKPSEILANIKRGFNDKGMPAFANIYNDEQLTNIVDYILSKRQGFSNLTYKIYHIPEDAPQTFDLIKTLAVKKSGKVLSNLIDIALPEVKSFMMEFEGDLYTPADQKTFIFAMIHLDFFEIEIDGEIVKPINEEWMRYIWPVKAGKQHVKVRYSTVGKPEWRDDKFPFFITDEDFAEKIFAISTDGKNFLNKATVNIKADTEALIQRKKIVKLPYSSIAVGFPAKVNYAFNTKSCAIDGLWTGDLLNIGPNIEGRGKDGSLILGEWLFHYPQQIAPAGQETACEFIKYNRQGHPTFYYRLGQQEFSVEVVPLNSKTLALNYQLLSGPTTPLTITLPAVDNVAFTSKHGKVDNNQFTVKPTLGKTFQLSVAIVEKK